jgi:hypothetical protein
METYRVAIILAAGLVLAALLNGGIYQLANGGGEQLPAKPLYRADCVDSAGWPDELPNARSESTALVVGNTTLRRKNLRRLPLRHLCQITR